MYWKNYPQSCLQFLKLTSCIICKQIFEKCKAVAITGNYYTVWMSRTFFDFSQQLESIQERGLCLCTRAYTYALHLLRKNFSLTIISTFHLNNSINSPIFWWCWATLSSHLILKDSVFQVLIFEPQTFFLHPLTDVTDSANTGVNFKYAGTYGEKKDFYMTLSWNDQGAQLIKYQDCLNCLFMY